MAAERTMRKSTSTVLDDAIYAYALLKKSTKVSEDLPGNIQQKKIAQKHTTSAEKSVENGR
jgi:hypothetical protein